VAVAQVGGQSDSQIVVTASGSSVAINQGDVVITSDTGAIVRALQGWSYAAAVNITAVSPSRGQRGTLVTISGSGLLGAGIW